MAPGKRFRQRSVEGIADEMAALYHQRGIRQFVFHDDNFLVPSVAINDARLSAFGKALKDRGLGDIALAIKCRPADANREIFRRLKELGLVRVFFGVESATARGLSVLERHQSVDDSERALELCSDLDISAQFTLMTFNPDATRETLHADVAFMRRFSGNPLNFCRAEIYTGTPLEQRMIELGRARGDYLARVYSLSDSVAERACNISLDLFATRCWSSDSLMQKAIGLDHVAAVAKRFYAGPERVAVCTRVANWLRSVNLDTIDLLDEVIELSASVVSSRDAGLQRAILALREHEASTRQNFLSEAANLRTELEALRFANKASYFTQLPGARSIFARQVAAAVLAVGIPATAGSLKAVGQEVKTPPPASTAGQETSTSSLAGTVTDPAGAVVANATIIITNIDTGRAFTLKTNEAGEYVANGLAGGHYSLKVESPGFRAVLEPDIALKGGVQGTKDIALNIGNLGCCEYAASPLDTYVSSPLKKRKPFTYVVGDDPKDNNTFQGIARLAYGDSDAWIQLFEANRNVVARPGFIPSGTEILIPKRKRDLPKLVSKVMPIYPPVALQDHIMGDVVMDIKLKNDGTVAQVDVISGDPSLVGAATTAAKQWRFQTAGPNERSKFAVAISFGAKGKIRIIR